MAKRSSTGTPNEGEPSADKQAEIDRLVAEATPEQREEWRAVIEQGWKEAQAGQLVDGPEFMGRLLRRAMEQAGQPTPPTSPLSGKRSRK
jgi:hypothetical protein